MKINTLKNFLFVYKCPGCREPIELGNEENGVFCEECRKKWIAEQGKLCPLCHLPADECSCMPENMRDAGADALIKFCFYETDDKTVTDRLLLYIKDYRDKRVVSFVANRLAYTVKRRVKDGFDTENTVFAFLPRSRSALNKKGFDQAEMLAKECSSYLGLRAVSVFKRTGISKQQKGLSPSQRHKNAEKTILPKKNITLSGKTVILIDDVVTTGAGMSRGIKLLREMGAAKIICAAVARSEDAEKQA